MNAKLANFVQNSRRDESEPLIRCFTPTENCVDPARDGKDSAIHQGRQCQQYAAVGNAIAGTKERGRIIEQSEVCKLPIHPAMKRIGVERKGRGFIFNRYLNGLFRFAGSGAPFRRIARRPRKTSGQFWDPLPYGGNQ